MFLFIPTVPIPYHIFLFIPIFLFRWFDALGHFLNLKPFFYLDDSLRWAILVSSNEKTKTDAKVCPRSSMYSQYASCTWNDNNMQSSVIMHHGYPGWLLAIISVHAWHHRPPPPHHQQQQRHSSGNNRNRAQKLSLIIIYPHLISCHTSTLIKILITFTLCCGN